jgi:RNase adapter protein RapZ
MKREPASAPERRRIVIVTGLSGAGKASALRALEDIGYEAVDNPPIRLLESLATRADRDIAIGIDARTRGFDAEAVLTTLASVRRNPALRPELVFVWADEATLLRRYNETRRRHPLAPRQPVAAGIAIEQEITGRLRETADLVIDTSELSVADLRKMIEDRFGPSGDRSDPGMVLSLISFSYARGLPREADLVFDARFLRNPHYDPMLRPRTGVDPEVGAYIRDDPDYAAYVTQLIDLIDLVLPRFVREGKKYATIAIGCTGGRHRSVYIVEQLAAHLSSRQVTPQVGGEAGVGWRLTVMHRELHSGEFGSGSPVPKSSGLSRNDVEASVGGQGNAPGQAQEA